MKITSTHSHGCQKMRSVYGSAAKSTNTYQKGKLIVRGPSLHPVGHLPRPLTVQERIARWVQDQIPEWHAPARPQSQTTTFLPLHPQKARYDWDVFALEHNRRRKSTYLSATRLGPGLEHSGDGRFVDIGNCPLKYCPAFAGGRVHPSFSQRCSMIQSASPRSII